MGRAKLKMELIRKEKSRIITFNKRKEGLKRKLHELTTLCDINACMIIYGPKQAPEIWPQNPDKVQQIIDICKAKKNKASSSGSITTCKTFGLSDFFHERKKKIEEELTKLRRKNVEAKYPPWPEVLNTLTEVQLREFGAALENKARVLKSRVEFLKRSVKQELDMMMNLMQEINNNQQQNYYSNNMMMLMMNHGQNDYHRSVGASTSGKNVDCASFKSYGYEPKIEQYWVEEPMIWNQQCYVPPMVYGHGPMMSSVVAPSSQMQFPSSGDQYYYDVGQEDMFRYLGV